MVGGIVQVVGGDTVVMLVCDVVVVLVEDGEVVVSDV